MNEFANNYTFIYKYYMINLDSTLQTQLCVFSFQNVFLKGIEHNEKVIAKRTNY